MLRTLRALLPALLLAAAAWAQAPDGFTPPHVLMIGIDTWRGDHLGRTGNDWIETPHLDALAADGVAFSRCYSTAPWTLPSFASIMTGLLPYRHGAVGGEYQRLGEDHVTLAEYLAAGGYATAGFVSINYLSPEYGMGQGYTVTAPPGLDLDLDRADRITWLGLETLRTRDLSQPHFLFLHYFDVHAPYAPPPPYDRMYYRGNETAPGPTVLSFVRSDANRAPNKTTAMYDWLGDVTDLQFPVKQYAAGVSYVDDHVGQIVAYLKQRGLYDRMLIVVVSDHGEHLGEHDLWFTHLEPYQECLHVPLLIKLPHNAFGGQVLDEPVSTLDVLPTVLDALTVRPPEDIDGRTLLPLIAGQTQGHRTRLMAEQGAVPGSFVKTLIDWPWKIMVSERPAEGRRVRLFNLNDDPYETVDLAAEHAAKAERMERRLWRTFDPENPIVEGRLPIPADVDEETRRKLEALGY
ncbi:sulfatase [bacterium]|nr:sulfatase [bacterium]HPF35297.1 sulfatase [Candidatus Krumholzibacteria bacterium]HRX50496.1 sulfatase [Candidatus Krumholzibacteria bacterium]